MYFWASNAEENELLTYSDQGTIYLPISELIVQKNVNF